MLTQELVKISRRFIGTVKFTSQDLDHFSHTSGSGQEVTAKICQGFKECGRVPISLCSERFNSQTAPGVNGQMRNI